MVVKNYSAFQKSNRKRFATSYKGVSNEFDTKEEMQTFIEERRKTLEKYSEL